MPPPCCPPENKNLKKTKSKAQKWGCHVKPRIPHKTKNVKSFLFFFIPPLGAKIPREALAFELIWGWHCVVAEVDKAKDH